MFAHAYTNLMKNILNEELTKINRKMNTLKTKSIITAKDVRKYNKIIEQVGRFKYLNKTDKEIVQ